MGTLLRTMTMGELSRKAFSFLSVIQSAAAAKYSQMSTSSLYGTDFCENHTVSELHSFIQMC